MFKPQQASQQTPQRFFTLEVQLTADCKVYKERPSVIKGKFTLLYMPQGHLSGGLEKSL
jgi:hypothetical protein